jgi:hypothetical protein
MSDFADVEGFGPNNLDALYYLNWHRILPANVLQQVVEWLRETRDDMPPQLINIVEAKEPDEREKARADRRRHHLTRTPGSTPLDLRDIFDDLRAGVIDLEEACVRWRKVAELEPDRHLTGPRFDVQQLDRVGGGLTHGEYRALLDAVADLGPKRPWGEEPW